MISVVCAGNRDSTASLLMEWYNLASKQGLMWIGTLISMIPLASWPLACVSGQVRHVYRTCLFVLQLSFWGMLVVVQQVQLMRPDQKHTANIMILWSALCWSFCIRSWQSHRKAEIVWPLKPLNLRNINTKMSHQLSQYYSHVGYDNMLLDKYRLSLWRIFTQQAKTNLSHYSHNAHGHITNELQLQQHHYNNCKSPTSPT